MRRSQAPSAKRGRDATDTPAGETEVNKVARIAAPIAAAKPLLHPPKAPSVTAPTPAAPAAGNAVKRYFSVVWCKSAAAARKHIKWEGDAILSVSGARATLQDMDGKEIGTTTAYSASTLASLGDGETIDVGSKHLEIMGKIAPEAYESGKCFLSSNGQRSRSIPVARPLPAKPLVAKENKEPDVKPPTEKQGNLHSVAALESTLPSPLQPRHDPRSPNALVLPRPSAAHARANGQGKPIVDVVVDPKVGNILRPHQREGVTFLYECVMGLRDFNGCGAILADEMGLGKTLQTVTLIWTLLKQGPYGKQPVARRALVVCPATLVKNWQNEFKRWLGDERVRTFAVDHDGTDISKFVHSTIYSVLIVGYERFRTLSKDLRGARLDIAVFDEGHKLKNANVKISQTIRDIQTPRRVILTGTPIQNDLSEFFAMVDVINPGVLGTYAMFKKVFEDPIVAARQKNCTPEDTALGEARSAELLRLTGMFILRRTNDINKKYLPAKTEVVLFCPPTETQTRIYRSVVGSNVFRMATGTAASATMHLYCLTLLRKLCNSLVLLQDGSKDDDDAEASESPRAASTDNVSAFEQLRAHLASQVAGVAREEQSGKMNALKQLLRLVKAQTKEKVVLVSSYTQTLDVFEALCGEENYSFLRLDGSTPTNKRQAIVDRFNSKHFDDYVLLLSARAGGVGLNLIGASRIVLFDINWNPAIDLQAMARIWREGQTRPVVVYRFLTTGSIEEKVYQRQLSKIALSDAVIDEKQGAKMAFTREDMRDLFAFHEGVSCLTHDLMGCDCLRSVEGADNAGAKRSAANKKIDADVSAGLQELREWQHINAANCADVQVKDEFLRDLVASSFASFVFHRHAKSPANIAAEEAAKAAENTDVAQANKEANDAGPVSEAADQENAADTLEKTDALPSATVDEDELPQLDDCMADE